MRLVALTLLLVAAVSARTPGIFQAEVLALENCSCVAQFGGGPLSRLYNLDARNAARSGLNHQYSNLKAVLGEGLGLGRAVLLGPPPLTLNHNSGLPFLYHRWSDFLSFERSTCRGFWRTTTALLYHDGAAPTLNAAPGLLQRRPGPKKNHVSDSLNLFRKLPDLTDFLARHRLVATLAASDTVLDAVPPVAARLKALSTTGRVAVVHCRRGDKLERAKYCPAQMDRATSPERIAALLAEFGVEPGSSVYLMSNDRNLTHFAPLATAFGYPFLTQVDFPHLAALLAACGGGGGGLCENSMLYAMENEIMRSVPRKYRFVTLPKADMDHNPTTLFAAFSAECTPHRRRRF
ncbi:hypothetical protein JL722_11254 [Aureococcus anophagefferens]|nr:hypothetical protein JL722_11254 [Aureococcus anophagefferens]